MCVRFLLFCRDSCDIFLPFDKSCLSFSWTFALRSLSFESFRRIASEILNFSFFLHVLYKFDPAFLLLVLSILRTHIWQYVYREDKKNVFDFYSIGKMILCAEISEVMRTFSHTKISSVLFVTSISHTLSLSQ